MIIQFNTDHNIDGNERLAAFLEEKVTNALSRFDEKITRVEIHLSDENGNKANVKTIRCLLEARMENMDPVAVTEFEDTVEKAVNGALDKMKASLDTIWGKMKKH